MMDIFLKLVNMSISASWLVLAVVLLRVILQKAPKAWRCILWALVGIRLICPFSIQSIFSLLPTAQPIPQNVLSNASSAHSAIRGSAEIELVTNPIVPETMRDTVTVPIDWVQILAVIGTTLWLIGVALMLAYAVVSYTRIRRTVCEAVLLEGNTYLCDHIPAPFILGVLRPRIYLPSGMEEADRCYVIAHEQAHLKRRDHLWKPLGYLLLAVYWFNPVMWLAYILLCKDIELACDEKVIGEMGADAKKPYADALIRCSAPRRMISACPVAFGENGVRSRIRSVLHYKKPALWVMIVAVILIIAVAVCFLTDPTGVRLREENPYRTVNLVTYSANGAVGTLDSQAEIDEVVEFLYDLRVSAEPISENRSEDRDKTYTITLGFEEGSNVRYHFNADCTEVWRSDYVKPTLTQKVYHPRKVREFFDGLTDSSVSIIGGADAPQVSYTEAGYQVYTCTHLVDDFQPVLFLKEEDHTFDCVLFEFSSYLTMGNYELTDSTLTLRTQDGERVYVFDVTKDAENHYVFHFDASRSSPNSKYPYPDEGGPLSIVPDGARFEYGAPSMYDTAYFDIDGDGKTETCRMHPNTLSGLSQVYLEVFENGRAEFSDYITTQQYDLSFTTDENGETCIRATRDGFDPPERIFDIELRDGEITLYENGEAVGGSWIETCE